MIVFLAGMMRSGSTFSFNVVRELLSSRGLIHAQAGNSVAKIARRNRGADHVIVKGHNCDRATMKLIQAGSVRTICTWRKPVDAIASWMDTFGFDYEQSTTAYREWFAMFEQIRENSLVLSFDDIEKHPQECVRRIAAHLVGGITPDEVAQIADRCSKANAKAISDSIDRKAAESVDIGFSYYDKTTFLHRRHVTSLEERPATGRIPDDLIARIEREFPSEFTNWNLRAA